MSKRVLIPALFLLFAWSCKPEHINPYDSVVPEENPQDAIEYPVGSFAYLYKNVFKPTCANSGCHDGTFEPDFRTISSSYNTLVHQPVIANDATNSFEYRVVPGDTSSSLLHERLLRFLPNSSGIMPLALENNSDWPSKKNEYIQAIKSWIMSGALDVMGNPAPQPNTNQLPMNYGLAVFPPGNTTNQFQRGNPGFTGIGPFIINGGVSDVYIYPWDDNAGLINYQLLEWELSYSATDFQPIASGLFYASPVVHSYDFGGSAANFTKRSTIDFSPYSGETVYMRVRMNDGLQETDNFVPTNNSAPYWYAIYSFQIP
jgi:hypothetical protein